MFSLTNGIIDKNIFDERYFPSNCLNTLANESQQSAASVKDWTHGLVDGFLNG